MSLHPSSSPTLPRRAVCLFGVCAGLCVAAPTLAATTVGSAASINQSVTGALSGREFLVSVGDEVKLRETVRTDASGQARLLLVDDTDVAILSRSRMTVERYAPGSKVVSAPDGTFIVHTGHGSAGELHINTSAGTLTPQGTRFWFDVRGGRMKLDVQEGAVRFCPRGKSEIYCVVATPGHEVTGSAGVPAQVQGMRELPPGPPISPSPIIYNGGSTNTNVGRPPPLNCYQTRSCGCGPYHRCGTGVNGMREPPPGPPISPSPIIYNGGNTNTNVGRPPSNCSPYHRCGTGATGGGNTIETMGTNTYNNHVYARQFSPYRGTGMFHMGGFRFRH
jgi:FecR protein